MKRTRKAETGQATLEMLFSAMGTVIFVSLLLGAIYLAGAKVYLRFSSHEFLLCREFQNPILCENKFKSQLNSFWRFGTWSNLSPTRTAFQQSVHVDLKLRILNQEVVKWNYQDQINLPLKF